MLHEIVLDLGNGSHLGLDGALLDAMNRFLGKTDPLGELILAQSQDSSCGANLGRERGSLGAQGAIKLEAGVTACCFDGEFHRSPISIEGLRRSPRRLSRRGSSS